LNSDGQLDGNEVRRIDPDSTWLSDDGTYVRPYTRFSAGRGRFLVRVTYVPSYKLSRAVSAAADEFDEASGMIHIESIGRPGEYDPNDPTMFLQDPSVVAANSGTNGVYKKVEAWVPVGLVDQLWWITNATNEQGAAEFGVPTFVDASNNSVTFPQIFEGGFRSNRSVEFKGDSVFRLYPARGEKVQVAGRLGSGPGLTMRVQAMDDNGQVIGGNTIPEDNGDEDPTNDSLIFPMPTPADDPFAPDSDAPTGPYDPNYNIIFTQDRVEKRLVIDERQRRVDSDDPARNAIRFQPPNLDESDPITNLKRWLLLTRDSGRDVIVPDPPGAGTRRINTGWYGLTGPETLDFYTAGTPSAATLQQTRQLRALGLYVDNFGDIQYPEDRAYVKNEWLQRGSSDAARNGWLGDYYIPSVREEGINHPVAEMQFIMKRVSRDGGSLQWMPFIRITRFDLDQRQMNVYPATDRQRQFHRWVDTDNDGNLDTLVPVGFTQDFDYPANGVVYCEGSIRVRGLVGIDPGLNGNILPQSLTVVSGGSIYLEGNLLTVPGWNIGLMAQDYVTLNPTAFTRIRPGNDVVVEADEYNDKGKPIGWHFSVPQGGDLDFSFDSANALQHVMLFLKHTGLADDSTSTTQVSLVSPAGSSVDFNITRPPNTPGFGNSPNLFYEFRQIPAVENPVPWAVSNFQTANGSPANWEQKTFVIRNAFGVGATGDQTFRMTVGENLAVNAQPYWLSRAVVMPYISTNSTPFYRIEPMKIRIEAVLYAYTGSWFVIPPPVFNRNPADTRANFLASNLRATGVIPQGDGDPSNGLTEQDREAALYPFYNEPLNYDIEVHGAINENKPAEPNEQAEWTRRLWRSPLPTDPANYDLGAFPRPAALEYQPHIRYRYNQNLKRLVRARITRQGEAGTVIAWVDGNNPALKPANVPFLSQVVAAGLAANSYVETLPLLPKLPSSSLVYEGNALQ
jgi:hypothetical protein